MIAQLIFDWAERTPEKTALIYNGRPWSYRAFARIVRLSRSYFARRGYAGPGYAVLAVRNLMDFWVVGLGLRSVGLDTVAIWAAATLDLIDLPNIRCVVTSSLEDWPSLVDKCAERGLELLSISLKGEPRPERGDTTESIPPGGHILLTSGTTGTRKMVLSTPENDAAFLPQIVAGLDVNRESGFCVFDFPPWTGIGYKWAASAWLVGGTTLIEQDGPAHQALLRPEITHGVLGPATLDRILAAPEDAFQRNDRLKFAVGAGAMSRSQFEQAKRRITPNIINVLASTEGGLIGITPLETADDIRWHRIAPGRAIEIVDNDDNPVAIGETGRLRIATAGGPTGYINNDAATAEFFRNGYFYPGDLAMMRSDGMMALQGRVTDVINISGNKFAPAMFEDHFRDVLGCAVCLFSAPGPDGDEELHCAVESSSPAKAELLIADAGKELPAFARTKIHCIPALPRNDMGKIMRAEVRAMVLGGTPAATSA